MSFEKEYCNQDDLTFDGLEADPLCDSAFHENQSLFIAEGKYTNLGLLLSDQCPFLMEVTNFKGTDRQEPTDRNLFHGSIVRQLDDTLRYLSRLDTSSHPDYPQRSIKEVLLNCVCHRDYSVDESTQVSIFEDRIEFVSFGSLIDGMDTESIKLGVAHSRNPILASVLYSMNLCDNFGTGISKIRSDYDGSGREPLFQTSGSVFKVTLYNLNSTREKKRQKAFFESEEDQILRFAREQGFVSRKEVDELLDCGTTKSFTILKKLCDQGLLAQEGKGRNSVYVP